MKTQDYLEEFPDQRKFWVFDSFLKSVTPFMVNHCDQLFQHGTLLKKLKSAKYDILLVDSTDNCGLTFMDFLNVPSLLYSNFGFTLDTNVFFPYIPSWMCNADNQYCLTDQMPFEERLLNFVVTLIFRYYWLPYQYQQFDDLRMKYGILPLDGSGSASRRAVTLAVIDFTLDFPRPYMPHVIPISYLFYEEHKDGKLKANTDLSKELLSFMEGSGQHGVIVMSFGTLIAKIKTDKAEIFAKVFSKLPNRVIWRYTGEVPESLGNNTKLVSWFPQPLVLSHPRTKAFITHCGASSMYEAVHNAVPVLALPLFYDQFTNAEKLVQRAKMGIKLDFDTLDNDQLANALNNLLNNDTYKLKADVASRMVKDNLVSPKEEFLYWVTYVARYKGATHLISETAHHLNIFQYLLLDIILPMFFILAVIIASMLFLVIKLCSIFGFSADNQQQASRKVKLH